MDTEASANIRMYRLNELGDCFLITFIADARKSRMLIDCGSFRNSGPSISRLKEITAHIRAELDGAPLDVVIGTHQHNDHLSGFVHCAKTFRAIEVGQVWLSWLDDPDDSMARRIGDTHNNFKLAVFKAHNQLKMTPAGRRGLRSLEVLEDLLGFYGVKGAAPPELPADAVGILKKLGQEKPKYLRPGDVLANALWLPWCPTL